MSLSDIAKGLDVAVARVDKARSAAAEAQKVAAQAQADYVAAVQAVRDLHNEYQKIMQDILSFGGTQHVAR